MMEDNFKNFGILFNKVSIDDYTVLIPLNVIRCNKEDDNSYKGEFLGNVASAYEFQQEQNEVSIGFEIDIDSLKNKYNCNDLSEAIINYRNDICNYIYIQNYDYKTDILNTYKIDFESSKMIKIATFSDEEIKMCNEEVEFQNNDLYKNIKKIYNPAVIDKNNEKNNSTNININMKKLYEELTKTVISQDKAIKQIISTIDRNYNIDNYRNKTNILLIGPSGCGKTEIFRTIADIINVPMTIEDSEQYSAVGYYGSSISDMLVKLYHKANGDLKKAERGILVIDEIDKKVSGDKDNVSGTRVLNSLLSLMEGTEFRINTTGDDNDPNFVNFDTSYLTVVLAGAFSDLANNNNSEIGFNSNIDKKKNNYSDIEIKDLVKYGMTPEILRRVSIYKLNSLTVSDLIGIMKKSKNSSLKEYYSYAKKKNVKLNITDDGINALAKIAYEKNIGASGIKATLNDILNEAFFEIGMNEDTYSSIKISEETLKKIPPYKLIKKRKTK